MTELFNLHTPADAWQHLLDHFHASPRHETLVTWDALDRYLSAPIASPQNLPTFARSTMDGYAVNAADTFGASPGLPAFLTVVGEAAMGQAVTRHVGVGEAMLVHTGSMIPPGANAVVMVEQTQQVDGESIEVMKAVAEGESVLQVGEDVRKGDALFAAGHRLRPQDIGGLVALGITQVNVVVRPRIAIISSGDEVVAPEATPGIGQVRDINSYALAAQVQRAGGEPMRMGIVPDQRAALEEAAAEAYAQADMVIFSAGSSVSDRDMTADIIDDLGAPGVLVHGVSVKPGKPAIVAVCDGKPVFGLPGNPVSAMVIFDLFVGPAIRLMMGAAEPMRTRLQAKLARNLASVTGRVDFVAVRLEERTDGLWAVPVLGKSNLIYTLVHADGTVIVPLDSNGIAAGTVVEVIL
jgi:molybdopterin molybdotransferase